MKALVVAPEDALRRQLVDFFRSRGHEVRAVADTAAAREALASDPVHHVLLDLGLGPEAIAGCRDATRRSPWILVLTPEESPERLRSAFEAGADDYLPLPVSVGALQLRLAIGERALAARRRRWEVERRVEEGEQRYRTLLETLAEGVLHLDADGVIVAANSSLSRITGFSAHELVGERADEFLVDPSIRDRLPDRTVFGTPIGSEQHTIPLRSKEGGALWVTLAAAPLPATEPGGRPGAVGVLQDVTGQRQAEAALDRERTFFQQLFRNSPVGIAILDDNDSIVDSNGAFTELFGYELAEIRGRRLSDLIVPEPLQGEATELSRAVFDRRTVAHETVRRRKDGTVIDVSIVGYPIVLGGQRIGAFGLYTDITERKRTERKLVHDAFHDALTDLPNRTLMCERLERCLRRARRHPEYLFAVLFLDLDGFKGINDRLGHAAGDDFLIETARRLERSLRPGDTVARLGGDEFTVILDDLAHLGDATRVAERILEALAQAYQLGDEEVLASGSLGIAVGGASYESAEALLHDADLAMYRAKSGGKARYVVFDPALHRGDGEVAAGASGS